MTLFWRATVTPGVTIEAPRADEPVRPVERADLLGVVRIEERTFEHPWPLGTFEQYLDAAAFLVLEDPHGEGIGEDVAGYVVASVLPVRGQRVGHVKDLAVKPERQGAGRGRRLLEAALSRLARSGADRVRLEVRPSNDPAVSLYLSTGFAVVGREEGYYQDGEDALIMTRTLPEDPQ